MFELPLEDEYATTYWTIGDVQQIKPDWSDNQCHSFLYEIEERLHEAMCAVGWEIIHEELEGRTKDD